MDPSEINTENLQYKKTADSVLLSLFMRTNGMCNNSHAPSTGLRGIPVLVRNCLRVWNTTLKLNRVKKLWLLKTRNTFFLRKNLKYILYGLIKMFVMHWHFCWTTCLFDLFSTKLYRQVVWIPIGTNCAPLVADLFLLWYERDFMMSLSDDKLADTIDAFNTTSRYLHYILNIYNVYLAIC